MSWIADGWVGGVTKYEDDGILCSLNHAQVTRDGKDYSSWLKGISGGSALVVQDPISDEHSERSQHARNFVCDIIILDPGAVSN